MKKIFLNSHFFLFLCVLQFQCQPAFFARMVENLRPYLSPTATDTLTSCSSIIATVGNYLNGYYTRTKQYSYAAANQLSKFSFHLFSATGLKRASANKQRYEKAIEKLEKLL